MIYDQGTPPYMAIEALLAVDFVHKPQHDLESILYIILYICTFVPGPGIPPNELTVTHMSLPIRSWLCNEIREIGCCKLAHLKFYDVAILPYFMPYWQDFTPFVKDLIIACFPVDACLPNELRYDQALRILKTAYNYVGEPAQVPPASSVIGAPCLKQPNSKPSDRDPKKRKHASLLP
jgi:hypothetical protein